MPLSGGWQDRDSFPKLVLSADVQRCPAGRSRCPRSSLRGTGRNCRCEGGEQSEAAALETGSCSHLEGRSIIYRAVLQPLLCHPYAPLVCQWERTSEAPPARGEAREGLQEGLMEAFLDLVRENVREEVLLDVGEGGNCSDSIQEGAGKVRKQRATGTNSPSLCQ